MLDADEELAAVCRVYLQSEPDAVIAHAELRRVLRAADASPAPDGGSDAG